MAALNTYAGLADAVTEFAWRKGDGDFRSQAEAFISLAESRLNRVLQLRVMETNAPLVGVVGSRFIPLPDDYVEPFALRLTTFGDEQSLPVFVASDLPVEIGSGIPCRWCIDGANIGLDVKCDQAHTFLFRYRKAFRLSKEKPTNWLLDNHPDLYLAASLVWGAARGREDEEVTKWATILASGLEEVAHNDAKGVALAPLKVDASLVARDRFNIVRG